MERLKYMKETLMNCVQGQLGDLSSVDAEELGAAIDMIKDLEEAIYYCTIVEAMKEKEEEKEKYMMPYIYPHDYNMGGSRYMDNRYMDVSQGRMYYDNNGNEGRDGNSSNNRRYMTNGGETRREYPIEIRDSREGTSPVTRRMYMESKEMHKDKNLRMKELEQYMHELTKDLAEMIEGASAEEKQMLQEKMTVLAHKIV